MATNGGSLENWAVFMDICDAINASEEGLVVWMTGYVCHEQRRIKIGFTCTTVTNSSDLSWKPIFSDKPTLHDSSENIVDECNTVTVTVTFISSVVSYYLVRNIWCIWYGICHIRWLFMMHFYCDFLQCRPTDTVTATFSFCFFRPGASKQWRTVR